MSTAYFTADWHLHHKNVLEFSNRPFKTIEHMEEYFLNEINTKVKAGDRLYVLGDLSLGKPEQLFEFIDQIECHNLFVIRGNHDKTLDRLYQEMPHLFTWVKDLAGIKVNSQYIVLCHYALQVWNRSHHGAYCLFGHSHGNLPVDITALKMDVGVDAVGYTPISFEEVKEVMDSRASYYQPVDHHKPKI